MSFKKLSPHTYTPAKLGLSGVTLAAQRTSNSFHVPYRENLNVKVSLTARTTITAVTVAVDNFDEATNVWAPIQSVSISSGTGTLSDFAFSKAVSGTDTFNALFALDRAYDKLRIRISGTNGATGDVVSVSATVS